jgi:hypothetical protein
MIPFTDVNIVAVIVATIASMAVGFAWYMPQVFGNTWMKLANIKPDKSNMQKTMIQALVLDFISTYVIAMVLYMLAPATLQEGLLLGFILWVGFIVYVEYGRVIWEKKSVHLFAINAGHGLAHVFVTILVLMLWPF